MTVSAVPDARTASRWIFAAGARSRTRGCGESLAMEPWERSAIALVGDLASGALRAVDAVESHIARIEAVDGELRAVVWKRYEAARAEAAEADRRRAAGEPLGALHGLPITIKECFDLAGSPSTFGVTGLRDARATSDDRY